MTIPKFVQPDYGSQSGTAYPLAIDAAVAVMERIAAAFAAHEQSTPDMTVRLDAGSVYNVDSQTLTAVAAQSSATITAPSTNPRSDIVYIDESSGAVGVATGTEAASPSDPTIPAGKLPVARINLTTGTTTITNSIMDDLRAAVFTGWLKPDGDGSSLSGITTGATATEAANIKINSLRIATLEDDAFNLMEDMIVDAFTTEGGVDVATSSNETYDASNDFYTTLSSTETVDSGSSGWNTSVGFWTHDGSGRIYRSNTSYNYGIHRNSADLTGDFDFKFTMPDRTGNGGTGANASWQFGVSTSVISTTFNSLYNRNSASLYYMTIPGTGSVTITFYNQQTSQGTAAVTVAAGDVFTIRRVGSTLYAYQNDTLIHTFTGFSTTAAVYQALGHGGTANENPVADFLAVTWVVGISVSNMTLVSNAFTADAEPTTAELLVLHEPVDSVTLNTDLVADVSIDGGSNWDTVTLSDEGEFSTGVNILRGSADVTARTGTSMKWRLTTANNKEQRARGIAMGWS